MIGLPASGVHQTSPLPLRPTPHIVFSFDIVDIFEYNSKRKKRQLLAN